MQWFWNAWVPMLFIEQPQFMPERNPRRSVNSHVHTCLHTRFFLLYGIARGIHDWRIRNTKLLVAEPFQMSYSGGNKIKQRYESKRWLSLEQSSYLACVIARLTVIFHSCWGFCTCVDTCMCDRTYLSAWTAAPPQTMHFKQTYQPPSLLYPPYIWCKWLSRNYTFIYKKKFTRKWGSNGQNLEKITRLNVPS